MATDATSPAVPPSKDSWLVVRIREGDSRAEEELVNSYRRAVLLIATVRTRDRELANDLSQEILIAVLQALRAGQIRESEKLGAFIQGTARNVINNYFRSRARHPESDLETAEIPTDDPVTLMESVERQRLVREELSKLSLADQQILLLSIVDGHSLAEIAKRLQLSHDAVRARKSRIVRRMINKFGRGCHKLLGHDHFNKPQL